MSIRAMGAFLILGRALLFLATVQGFARAAENKPATGPQDPAALEFFEKEVRPLLASRCQSCHGPNKQKGELRLDSIASILTGGSTGPAIVPGKPTESLLVDAINYRELYKMPPKSKLPAHEIATLTRWVELGAPWPSQSTPTASAKTPKAFNLKERASQWCFQPIRVVSPPSVKRTDWARTPVDLFILAALEAKGLSPSAEADKRTLIRRLTFDLIGLPPSPAEIDAFLADDSPAAYERLVDRLLASPHYGERWGRHWLDLARFAETSGHEFDYNIPDAYRYRDYVVRAFNADLPYDQFVTEHVAGDLLESPRRHPTERTNESIVATGFFHFYEGTHSPVDVHEDAVRRTENQVEVFAKTFLGLTVACARCHDHKFDAISTKDYYALAGYLRSARHQRAFVDPPDRIIEKAEALRGLKERIKPFLPGTSAGTGSQVVPADKASVLFEDFNKAGFDGWFVTGDAFGNGPTQAGDFVLAVAGAAPTAKRVAAGQAHSGLVSDRLQGVLRSRTFTIEKPFIQYLASGRAGRVNVVVDGFEKIRDPIYGGLSLEINSGDATRWFTQNVAMWIGHRAYLEICDGAAVNYNAAQTSYFDGNGFIAVDQIRFSEHPAPPASPTTPLSVPVDLSKNDPTTAKSLAALVAEYKAIEATIPPPTLAPALTEGTGEDERVHIRGSYQTLGDVVPRRFLEAIAGSNQTSADAGGGRLELARRMVDRSNPLLPRVIVNRIWKHHFGEGIVRSTDDFGNMGQAPSHPELLDYLADQIARDGWSLKKMHRRLLLSSTYRMSSTPEPEAERVDPTNRLLHRMNVRRLEAESIRDSILAIAGQLNRTPFGPSVPVHLTSLMEGRGRPGTSGPLDGNSRRSLYLNVRRNFLNPMFLAFDLPTPFSTMGRRNVSNVPAQALTLLNDPFVVAEAKLWADRVLAEHHASPRENVDLLYAAAFGRPPSDREVADALAFLGEQAKSYRKSGEPRAWADLCHVLFNVKEFIYVN